MALYDVINRATFAIYAGPYRSLDAAAVDAVMLGEQENLPLMAVERPSGWTPTYYANKYAGWAVKPVITGENHV